MKKLLFSLIILCASACLSAQTVKSPFEKFGYKKQIMYTSSKGEFEEFHDRTDIVEIGSVLFDTKQNKVVGFVDEQKEETSVNSFVSAMSIDPLCEKYYWVTPYAYCFNNPLKYVDPDGRDGKIIINDINNTITIKANIILYSNQIGVGKDILNEAANNYKQNITDNWSKDENGNAWTYQQDGKTYTVNFDINVSVDIQAAYEKNRDYNGENNYIEVVKGDDRTFTSKVSDTNQGKWSSETNAAAHEFGHVVGLQDRYTNTIGEDGKKRSIPNLGYENNIMGKYGKPAEQKNINAIVGKPYNSTAPIRRIFGIGIQYINKNNRENK
jgi:hypothetical protein